MATASLRLYFDGACHLCSREVEHYRRRDVERRIALVDIADAHFDAQREGLDPVAVNRHLHVRLADGSLRTGLDAFIEVWRVLPGFSGLARVASRPFVHHVLARGYRVFARVRPLLPKRKVDACESDACAARRA